MKHKHLKINDTTLFVYRNKTNSKPTTETGPPTEPTTTMITITKTGILFVAQTN
jgi:hypothetical protein